MNLSWLMTRISDVLRGRPATRIEAMRTVRIFFGAAVASREGLRPWIHAIAQEALAKLR